MKGLVKYALGMDGVALQELPEPSPKEGELKVKVLAAGICNSDVHAMHDQRSVTMPVVLGHEFVGQVVETCGDVGDFKVGDWVTALPACYSCDECWLCQQGLVTLCNARKSIGSHRNGAMANFVVVPAKYSFKIPDSALTLEEKAIYALTEPLACMTRAAYEKVDVKPNDTVVVSGPGIMGQYAAQLFKSRGAYVIVSGLPVDQDKLELAVSLGADDYATSFEELQQKVYARSPKGADITCDCAGVVPSLDTCTKVIRQLGTHVQVGLFGGKVPFRLDALFDREITYIPSNSSSYTSWKITMELLRDKKVTMTPFASVKMPLEEWEKGLQTVLDKAAYKVLLMPDNDF